MTFGDSSQNLIPTDHFSGPIFALHSREQRAEEMGQCFRHSYVIIKYLKLMRILFPMTRGSGELWDCVWPWSALEALCPIILCLLCGKWIEEP